MKRDYCISVCKAHCPGSVLEHFKEVRFVCVIVGSFHNAARSEQTAFHFVSKLHHVRRRTCIFQCDERIVCVGINRICHFIKRGKRSPCSRHDLAVRVSPCVAVMKVRGHLHSSFVGTDGKCRCH